MKMQVILNDPFLGKRVEESNFSTVPLRDEFLENARLFIFETYCRIHQRIDMGYVPSIWLKYCSARWVQLFKKPLFFNEKHTSIRVVPYDALLCLCDIYPLWSAFTYNTTILCTGILKLQVATTILILGLLNCWYFFKAEFLLRS